MSDILDMLKSTAAGRARLNQLAIERVESSFAAPAGSAVICDALGCQQHATGEVQIGDEYIASAKLNQHEMTFEPLPASDLFAVLGESAPSRDLTASKTADCIKRDGSQITGFVVTDQWGGIGIIDKSAVRWLTNKEMWWLMHTSAERGGDLDTANAERSGPAAQDSASTLP